MKPNIYKGDLVRVLAAESPLYNQIFEVSLVSEYSLNFVYLITEHERTRWYFKPDELEVIYTK